MSPRRNRQHGAALILLAALLTVGVCAFLVTSLNSATFDHTTTVRTRNAEALQQAKSALIGYVAKEALDLTNSVPGRLPCPETLGNAGTTNEGIAGSACAPAYPSARTVGRLPWRTLGIDKLVDGTSEPLWYVVSPAWVLSDTGSPPVYPVINPGTTGELSADGTTDIVAIIIAPGRPLNITPSAGQIAAGCQARNQARNDRSHVAASSANPDHRDYLECLNASDPIDASFGSAIVDNATNPVINDQMVVITAKDLLNAIQGPVAERMQRTVAPLLSEHGDKWVAAAGAKFLPYAVSYSAAPPETNPVTCGTVGTREGVLPTAITSTAGCVSTWQNFNITGTQNSAVSLGCSGSPVTCQFSYYRLSALGALLDAALNLLGLGALVGNVGNTGAVTVTVSADAPNAAVAFRDPLASADITVSGGLSHSMTLTPRTTGEASLAIQVPITSGGNDICTSLVGVVCNLLPGALATANTVTVQFPELADATVQGTQLQPAVSSPHTMNLLAPASTDPHHWFFTNQWQRFAYYAVAPTVSAAQSGGYLTVTGFPAANGSNNDKRFVLAAVGPAVTGQNSRPSTSVGQYLEGENASTGDSTFAHQVFSAPGNDRMATCPFSTGALAICN